MNGDGTAREPVAVVGAGYVGLVTAVGFAQLGHEVHAVEADPERLALLLDGRIPFFEPGLEDAFAEHRDRLHFAPDYDGARDTCRLFLVTVGTPTSDTGAADLAAVWSVIDEIPLGDGQAVVMRSTVPPGTGAACRRRLDERGLTGVAYVACPEFLRESTGLHDFHHPERLVIGAEPSWAVDAVEALHRPLVGDDRVVRTDVTTAETLKLAANAFLTAKISFINEIANLCDGVGADVTDVARGIGLDPRIGPLFLRAGLGFGGSCFGKDLRALAHEFRGVGVRSAMVDAILDVNDHQWERVVDKLTDHVGELTGAAVAVLGFAFKPGTSNVRDATSVPLLDGLVAAGADVRAYDPEATADLLRRHTALTDDVLGSIRFCDSALGTVEGADAAVLVTEWPELVGLDWRAVRDRMAGDLVIDGRNALDPGTVVAAGLRYDGVGRRSPDAQS